MILSLVRIDSRLIHGQVVTDWIRAVKCERIIVASDEVASDEIRKKLLISIAPPGIKINIVSIDKAAASYFNPKYENMRVLMLFTCPQDVLRMVEKGVPIKAVNVGGMNFQQGKHQITAAVSVDKSDVEAFAKLHEKGVKLEIQMLSSDKKADMMDKLKENHLL